MNASTTTIHAYDTHEARWQAVQTRDAEADGYFVYAVRTTGI